MVDFDLNEPVVYFYSFHLLILVIFQCHIHARQMEHFFNLSVIGISFLLKFCKNGRNHCIKPKISCNFFLLVGILNLYNFSIRFKSDFIPNWLIILPKYTTSFCINMLFSKLTTKFASCKI
ncbi:transposable element [Pseudoloma neurophilia]|uniref:Transposable element n=1 Tax=Pseudoloma neurophilia TaxID=146866 RepID=A0A0R0M5D1_9MICR|nr:transposable element [Pseudoloma neurophilia]